MKKSFETMSALLLIAVMTLSAGCKKNSMEPNNGGDSSNPTTEGIYLGIIGFNQHFTNKDISLLNNSSLSSFTNFIDQLSMENGTGLYYADYTALNKLKSYQEPPKLNNVALVTFTDGLDNVSLSSEETNPEHYTSTDAYRAALNNKIRTEQIHGKNMTAYTIGIKGSDVFDDEEFHNNLNMLASSSNNVYEVADMNQALIRFKEIAESLHSVTTTSTLKLQLPGGYNDGVMIRLTFDNVSSAENSSKYIECAYRWSDNGRRLEKITYHGLSNGSSTISSVGQTGLYYDFEFKNLAHSNGNAIVQSDINNLKLWRQISSGAWQPDVEFTPANSSQVTEKQSSALIMLVLDCTTSLGNQFNNMKTGAKRFVETLVTSTGGGGGNGGGNGGSSVSGVFSVSGQNKVYFSQGNLQYQASTNTWRFAENQWDYIGDANSNISSSYSGWIDLFGWGTGNNPTNSSFFDSNYDTFNEWGNNAINNGGNTANVWRTLTKNEWMYVFNTRNTTSGKRYAKATVNGINGVILLPDNWNSSNYSLSGTNNSGAIFSSNRISQSDWTNRLEAHGAVFLPATGYRHMTIVFYVGSDGYYWSATYKDSENAYPMTFGDGNLYFDGGRRSCGLSVRLVRDAQ